MAIKCAVIGAGSRSFGPGTVHDLLLSDVLCREGLEIALMDIAPAHLAESADRAERARSRLGRSARITATTDLDEALRGARFAICAIEVDRYRYWAQDFHVPRDHGFRQVYGENGGVGGIFHALRNMGPMVTIARRMAELCPGAVLLNYTNPEHKLCEAITRLTPVETYGLCHGVFMGQEQIARILGMRVEQLDLAACGINHFTWFQRIRDRATGQDLYPRLREIERRGDWFIDWHEIGLARVLLRRFGLWPSPGANHYGEYIRWADDYVVSSLQFHDDPAEGPPWRPGVEPRFVYTADEADTSIGWRPTGPTGPAGHPEEAPIRPSGEIAWKIVESLGCGIGHELEAVNTPNRGYIPNLDDGTVVEVPATADSRGLRPCVMEPLPEGIAALLRLQASIQKLIVEAFAEGSRDKLLQAVLLEPTVDSYRRAVVMVDRMLELQRDILPPLR